MRRPRPRPSVKFIIIFLVILLTLFLALVYICKSLLALDYFRVKDIITREQKWSNFSYLKGKNIFTVNLEEESAELLEEFPDYKKIRVAKIFPDCLFIDFIRRKPLALVKLYRYFAIDEEGVFFSLPGSPEELLLPVITGLETKLFAVKSGRKYQLPELNAALNILKELKRSRLRNLPIKKIDLSSLVNASFFIALSTKPAEHTPASKMLNPGWLEIRLGGENIKEKISFLASLIAQSKKDLYNIKYIDLRFKEPVIKFVKPQLSEQ